MRECRAQSASLLFVSHDVALGSLFDRVVSLADLRRPSAGDRMSTLALAWRSLGNRRGTALLTIAAIAVSVALLLGVRKSGPRHARDSPTPSPASI
jgi:hypothetical protein